MKLSLYREKCKPLRIKDYGTKNIIATDLKNIKSTMVMECLTIFEFNRTFLPRVWACVMSKNHFWDTHVKILFENVQNFLDDSFFSFKRIRKNEKNLNSLRKKIFLGIFFFFGLHLPDTDKTKPLLFF